MVALLRLLELFEVFRQLRLVFKRGSVEALQLWIFVVALVECAGDRHEFDRLAVAGAGDVRASAEIPEVAILIQRNRLARGDVVEEVDLEFARAPGDR